MNNRFNTVQTFSNTADYCDFVRARHRHDRMIKQVKRYATYTLVTLACVYLAMFIMETL